MSAERDAIAKSGKPPSVRYQQREQPQILSSDYATTSISPFHHSLAVSQRKAVGFHENLVLRPKFRAGDEERRPVSARNLDHLRTQGPLSTTIGRGWLCAQSVSNRPPSRFPCYAGKLQGISAELGIKSEGSGSKWLNSRTFLSQFPDQQNREFSSVEQGIYSVDQGSRVSVDFSHACASAGERHLFSPSFCR